MMSASLERSTVSQNERTATSGDGGVRKSTPPYACFLSAPDTPEHCPMGITEDIQPMTTFRE